MLTKLFTVYDSKVEAYLQPFHQPSTGAALRAFEETCADTTHNFYKHAADFTLFEIGTFEDTTCEFKLYEAKRSLGTALEYCSQFKTESGDS